MSRNKNLFLFAGYDKNGIANDALVYYVSQLSKHGDVIVYMDCDCNDNEIQKLQPYTIFTNAQRHGEYDFGSYKRAFLYAHDNDLLKNYDCVYFVNDSVFGPLFDITNTINKIEQKTTDAVGMVVATHKTHSYMESWFVRLNKEIFLTDWFYEFMSKITKLESKPLITIKYEHGLTYLIAEHNLTWSGIFTYHGRFTYNNPKQLFKNGCPFVKKASFIRHFGEHGKQIKYILNHCDTNAKNAVINTANETYGPQYMNWFLTSNPIKIFTRQIKYAFKKAKDKIS